MTAMEMYFEGISDGRVWFESIELEGEPPVARDGFDMVGFLEDAYIVPLSKSTSRFNDFSLESGKDIRVSVRVRVPRHFFDGRDITIGAEI